MSSTSQAFGFPEPVPEVENVATHDLFREDAVDYGAVIMHEDNMFAFWDDGLCRMYNRGSGDKDPVQHQYEFNVLERNEAEDRTGKYYLLALGRGIVACFWNKQIETWNVGTEKRIASLRLDDFVQTNDTGFGEYPAVTVGDGNFAFVSKRGLLCFCSHTRGASIEVTSRVSMNRVSTGLKFGRKVCLRASEGSVMVWNIKTGYAAIWSPHSREPQAKFRAENVWRCDISMHHVLVCTRDNVVHVHGRDGTLLKSFIAGRGKEISDVRLVRDLVVSVSHNGEIEFIDVSADDLKLVTRVQARGNPRTADFQLKFFNDRMALIDHHVAKVYSFNTPAEVAGRLRVNAFGENVEPALVGRRVRAVVTPSIPSPRIPLKNAFTGVLQGSQDLEAVCRDFVTEENCSRSLREWVYANVLLMAAIGSGMVPGSVDYNGIHGHWQKNLYLPVLSVAKQADIDDVITYCEEAQRVGVLENMDEIVERILESSASMNFDAEDFDVAESDVSKSMVVVIVQQMTMDPVLSKIGSHLDLGKRTKSMQTLCQVMSDHVYQRHGKPECRIAGSTSTFSGVWRIVQTLVECVSGNQGATNFAVLRHFLSSVSRIFTLEGVKHLEAAVREAVVDQLGDLEITWDEFVIKMTTAYVLMDECEPITHATEEKDLRSKSRGDSPIFKVVMESAHPVAMDEGSTSKIVEQGAIVKGSEKVAKSLGMEGGSSSKLVEKGAIDNVPESDAGFKLVDAHTRSKMEVKGASSSSLRTDECPKATHGAGICSLGEVATTSIMVDARVSSEVENEIASSNVGDGDASLRVVESGLSSTIAEKLPDPHVVTEEGQSSARVAATGKTCAEQRDGLDVVCPTRSPRNEEGAKIGGSNEEAVNNSDGPGALDAGNVSSELLDGGSSRHQLSLMHGVDMTTLRIEELERISRNPDAVRGMNVRGLALVISFASIGFEEEFVGFATALHDLLVDILQRNFISGKTLVAMLGVEDIHAMLVTELRFSLSLRKPPGIPSHALSWTNERMLLVFLKHLDRNIERTEPETVSHQPTEGI